MNAKHAIISLGIAVAVCLAFALGRLVQHMENGYSLRPLSEQVFEFPQGTLVLREFHELVGLGFMQPQTQTLTLEKPNAIPLTVYKAQVGFQEMYPRINAVHVNGRSVTWTDGIFDYELKMERVRDRTELQILKSSGW